MVVDQGNRENRPQAVVRTPTESLAGACLLTHVPRMPIDFERALVQHDGYVAALEECGVQVRRLPALEAYPDGTFVEDAALIFKECSILTRSGAEARRGEAAAIRSALPLDRPVSEVPTPGTLDGGDVLVVGMNVLVGLSTRTNGTGVEALRSILEPAGYRVRGIEILGGLHLKTVLTSPAPGILLSLSGAIDSDAATDWLECRTVMEVESDEPSGANVLPLSAPHGPVVLVSSSAPNTAERLAATGLEVRMLDIDEFEKAEAGLTCLSLIWR